jgi:hypothetical protein
LCTSCMGTSVQWVMRKTSSSEREYECMPAYVRGGRTAVGKATGERERAGHDELCVTVLLRRAREGDNVCRQGVSSPFLDEIVYRDDAVIQQVGIHLFRGARGGEGVHTKRARQESHDALKRPGGDGREGAGHCPHWLSRQRKDDVAQPHPYGGCTPQPKHLSVAPRSSAQAITSPPWRRARRLRTARKLP